MTSSCVKLLITIISLSIFCIFSPSHPLNVCVCISDAVHLLSPTAPTRCPNSSKTCHFTAISPKFGDHILRSNVVKNIPTQTQVFSFFNCVKRDYYKASDKHSRVLTRPSSCLKRLRGRINILHYGNTIDVSPLISTSQRILFR